MTIAIWITVYLVGYALCFTMQKIEHDSENNIYTKGDQALNVFISLLSFLMVIVILTTAWINKIAKTGYWNRPLKKEPAPIEVEIKNAKVETK